MPSTRATRRFKRNKREMIWTSTVLENVNAGVTTASIPFPLVLGSDWARNSSASFERGATLLGIRGWYQIGYQATSTIGAPTCYLVIHKGELDEDPSLSNWTGAAAYNNEDVLFTDGRHYDFLSGTSPATQAGSGLPSQQLEVRSKRKLNSDDTIDLSFVTPSANQDWSISGVFRALIAI